MTTRPRASRAGPVIAGVISFALGCGLSACGGGTVAPRVGSSPATVTSPTDATPPTGGTPPTGATSPAPAPAGPVAASSGPGLSRTQLAAKAGAICSAATAQGRKLAVPSDLTSNPHAAAAYFDKAVPPLDDETKAFQALVPQAAVSAQWEAVLGAQVALDRLADGYRQTAHAGRQTTLADIRQLVTVGQTIADAAVRLGARCT